MNMNNDNNPANNVLKTVSVPNYLPVRRKMSKYRRTLRNHLTLIPSPHGVTRSHAMVLDGPPQRYILGPPPAPGGMLPPPPPGAPGPGYIYNPEFPAVIFMPEISTTHLGGTMRLGIQLGFATMRTGVHRIGMIG